MWGPVKRSALVKMWGSVKKWNLEKKWIWGMKYFFWNCICNLKFSAAWAPSRLPASQLLTTGPGHQEDKVKKVTDRGMEEKLKSEVISFASKGNGEKTNTEIWFQNSKHCKIGWKKQISGKPKLSPNDDVMKTLNTAMTNYTFFTLAMLQSFVCVSDNSSDSVYRKLRFNSNLYLFSHQESFYMC